MSPKKNADATGTHAKAQRRAAKAAARSDKADKAAAKAVTKADKADRAAAKAVAEADRAAAKAAKAARRSGAAAGPARASEFTGRWAGGAGPASAGTQAAATDAAGSPSGASGAATSARASASDVAGRPITPVPALTAPRAATPLRSAEVVLDNGVHVVAVRKPAVPVVEVRLRLPFLSAKPAHPAQAAVLADTVLTGARGLGRAELAAAVQGLGADLAASVDADRLVFVGNVLAANLRSALDLLASVLTDPGYDRDEVAIERTRIIENLTIARARAGVIAAEALDRRMFGDHPYARDLPTVDAVAAVTPAQVRALHRAMVRPNAATLVLVGDLPPAKLIETATAALAAWTGTAATPRIPALPVPAPGPLALVDRPGSVQSSVRLGRGALRRTDPGYPALQLANLVFGGYFSSRWTENIREDKGYTYGPHSRLNHHTLGSTLTLEVEVATEVTGPAMLETAYELGRIASLPVTAAELDSVRQYAIGNLALSTATQAGLASTLSGLSAFGLGLDWLAEQPVRLLATTLDEVSEAAAQFFGPAGFTGVVVGDAASVTEPLRALGPVEAAVAALPPA